MYLPRRRAVSTASVGENSSRREFMRGVCAQRRVGHPSVPWMEWEHDIRVWSAASRSLARCVRDRKVEEDAGNQRENPWRLQEPERQASDIQSERPERPGQQDGDEE